MHEEKRASSSRRSPRGSTAIRISTSGRAHVDTKSPVFSPWTAMFVRGRRMFGMSLAKRVLMMVVVLMLLTLSVIYVTVMNFHHGLPHACVPSRFNQSSSRHDIFDTVKAKELQKLQSRRIFRARGFEFCSVLNNATFDGFVHVRPLNGSVMGVNPPMVKFTSIIDETAKTALKGLMDKNPALNIEHATRFSCLQAAEGANPYTNLSSSRLLHRLDPPTYFQPVLPSILPSASQISTNKRRHYRLAYLITAHGPIENLENLQLLTSLLDDGTAVFLVHVDLRAESEALYRGIHEWIEERNRGINEKRKRRRLPPGPGNVFLAKNRYAAIWGHVSMVYVQLSGGWELVDLAEWEYMINVSLEDVPLRRSREIFRFLSRKENAGRNFMSFEMENYFSSTRLPRPHIARGENLTQVQYHYGPVSPHEIGLVFPPFTNWKICLSPQWMILTRDFVSHLRTSDAALQALSYYEFTYIPDQSFFCQVLLNDPIFSSTVVNDMKRFLDLQYGSRTATLNLDHRHRIGFQFFTSQEPKYYFARKIDVRADEGKSLVKWILKHHLNKHVMPDESYGVIEGKEWTVEA